MARALTAGMINALIANAVRPAFLVEMGALNGTVRIWSGLGNIVWNGHTFQGAGNFGGVTAVQEASDLTATGIQLSLAGVNDTWLEIAIAEVRQGYTASLYLACLDTTGSLITDPYLLFQGITDVPEVNESGSQDSTITISAENRLINLTRPRERRYTSEDQKLDDPTDKGFDFVPSLQNAVILFG